MNSKKERMITKLDSERFIFYMRCSEESLKLCASGKKLNSDEVTKVLNEVWRFGYMELYNDIIKKNIKVINKEAEYYENLPDPWFAKQFLEELEKKVYSRIKMYESKR